MPFQSSNTTHPFTSTLSEEDAASIAALRRRAKRCKEYGQKELAWQLSARASEIVNRAMVKKLASGDVEPDDNLYYIEVPAQYPEQETMGLNIQLLLIAGSPLAQKVIALLEEDAKNGGII